MPQEGKKFVFTLHSYQTFTDDIPPDSRIKLGELHNDSGSARARARRWRKLLILALEGMSLAREYTQYAQWQAQLDKTPDVKRLLKRYFFRKPESELGTLGGKLREKQLRIILANLASLHQYLQRPLELLGTGAGFGGDEPPNGYVRRDDDTQKTNRKVHVLLDERRITDGDDAVKAITKTIIHEISHKVCNTHDYFYDPGDKKKLNIQGGITAYAKGHPNNQPDLHRLNDKARKYNSDDDQYLTEPILHMLYARSNADSYARFICAIASTGTAPPDPVTYQRITDPASGWLGAVKAALDTLLEACPGMNPGDVRKVEGGMQVRCTGKQ